MAAEPVLPRRPALTNTRPGSMPRRGKLSHATIRLMRDDMVHRLDSSPDRACLRCAMIEELRPLLSHRGKIVLELEWSGFDEGLVGTAGNEGEAGFATETDLAEEIAGNPRAGSGIARTNYERPGPVSHHHEIYQLTYVSAGALWIEVDRASLGPHDSYGFDPRH